MGFWKYVLGTPRNYALTLIVEEKNHLQEKQREEGQM